MISFRKYTFLLILTVLIVLAIPNIALADDAQTPTVTSLTALQEAINTSFNDRQTQFSVHYLADTDILSASLESILETMMNQDDYLKYSLKQWSYGYSGYVDDVVISFSVSYWETKEQVDYVNSEVQKTLSQIITTDMNVHQKEKAIHDYIVLNVAYDETYTEHSAYAALTTGRTVCQGYALLTYKMLKSAGIENHIVEGTAKGQGHSWNLVKLESKWYHLDSTWDDPVPDETGRVLYNYYNLADDEIAKDHVWTEVYPLTSTTYFDELNQLITAGGSDVNIYQSLRQSLGLHYLLPEYTAENVQDLQNILDQAVSLTQNELSVRYLVGSTITQDCSTVFNYLSEQYHNLDRMSYSYQDYSLGGINGDKLITFKFIYDNVEEPDLMANPVIQMGTDSNGVAGIFIGIKDTIDATGNPVPNVEIANLTVNLEFNETQLNVLEPTDLSQFSSFNYAPVAEPNGITITGSDSTVHSDIGQVIFVPIKLIGSAENSATMTVSILNADARTGAKIMVIDPVTLTFQRGKISNLNSSAEIDVSDAVAGLQFLAGLRSSGFEQQDINIVNMASISTQGPAEIRANVKDVIALLQYVVEMRDVFFNEAQ